MCGVRRVDCAIDLVRPRFVRSGDDMSVRMGHDHVERVARANFLSADDERDIDNPIGLCVQLSLELHPFRCSGRIGKDRFVQRCGGCGNAVHEGWRGFAVGGVGSRR